MYAPLTWERHGRTKKSPRVTLATPPGSPLREHCTLVMEDAHCSPEGRMDLSGAQRPFVVQGWTTAHKIHEKKEAENDERNLGC
jgi:hypothetical protein